MAKETHDMDINERLLAIQERQLALQEQQAETLKPKENPNYVARSLFLQDDGTPWARRLKCDIYLNAIHLNKTPLTKDEVDALNRLQPVEKARIAKIDDTTAVASVRAKEDAEGRLDRLTIEMPMKKDNGPNAYPRLSTLADQLAQAVA